MKRAYILTVLLGCLFTVFSSFTAARKDEGISASMLYDELHLADHGLSKEALDYAVKGYEKLVDEGLVSNEQYLSIVDFSQPSDQRRFYLIDLVNKELAIQTYVMHGMNSGNEMAEKFSNKVNSHQSSLGFYLTRSTYNGKRGYSLRISGLEKGFNTNAEKRGVVVHGSMFISEERAKNGSVLWSEGCPALPMEDYADVINMIKGGSVFFIYSPSEDYLRQSSLLNS